MYKFKSSLTTGEPVRFGIQDHGQLFKNGSNLLICISGPGTGSLILTKGPGQFHKNGWNVMTSYSVLDSAVACLYSGILVDLWSEMEQNICHS